MSRVNSRLKFIPPQLPTLIDEPPEGSQWFHEVKHDGYRTQLLSMAEKLVPLRVTAITGRAVLSYRRCSGRAAVPISHY